MEDVLGPSGPPPARPGDSSEIHAPPPGTARPPRFDLRATDPAHRAKVWSDALNEHVFSLDIDYPRTFNLGELESVVADHLRIVTATSDPMHLDRRASHVARDALDAYLLIVPEGGDIVVGQRGREVAARKGRFALASTTEPGSYRQEGTEHLHALVVPGPLVRARKPDVDDHLGGDFRGSSLQGIFADFAASLCRHAPHLDGDALRRTQDSLLDMLALVLERTDAASNETVVQMAHRRRVLTLVESRFRDPDTGLAEVARALDLSPRYVQRILAAHGETVSDLLRRRRVAEACRLLDRRGASRASVATIAYGVGYADPAYFSRVFRRSMGMSPTDYAAQAG